MELSQYKQQLENKSKPIEKNPTFIGSNKMDRVVELDGSIYTIEDPEVKIIEEQKIYVWSRLYLKEEFNPDLEIGDIIKISYRGQEELETQFISYGFKNLEKDHEDEITEADQEIDDKILILMVDQNEINYSTKIPFIQTLFKNSMHYSYEIYKRSELLFINNRTGESMEYFDADL